MLVKKFKNIAITSLIIITLIFAVYYRFWTSDSTYPAKNVVIQTLTPDIKSPVKIDEDTSISYRYIYKKGMGVQYSALKEKKRVHSNRNPFYSALVINPEHSAFFYNLPAVSTYISSELNRIRDELQGRQAKEINYDKEKISNEIIRSIKFDGLIKSGDIYLIAGGKEYRKGDTLPINLKGFEIKKEHKDRETPGIKEFKEVIAKFKETAQHEMSRYEDKELNRVMEEAAQAESEINRLINPENIIFETDNVIIKDIREGAGRYDVRVIVSLFKKEHVVDVLFEPAAQHLIVDTSARKPKLELWGSGKKS